MKSYIIQEGNSAKKLAKLTDNKSGKLKFSVVIPTYNEADGIASLVNEIQKSLKSYEKADYEIIIVDDNSKDGTPKVIDGLAKRTNVVAVHRFGVNGIFSAVQDGIKVAKGRIIVMLDADFSHPPKIIPKLLSYIDDYELVSGSRFVKGGGIKAPFFRQNGPILLNFACRTVMGVPYKDLTGGFHAIRKSDFNKLDFKYPTIFGEFDLELFYLAHKQKFRILEIPFVYKFRSSGKSKVSGVLRTAWHYFVRAVQLRLFR